MSETTKMVLVIGGIGVAMFLFTRSNQAMYPPGNVYPAPVNTINQDQVALNAAANIAAGLIPSPNLAMQIFGSASGGAQQGGALDWG